MKHLEKKYYIIAACSFVGVGLVAYLWLNKDQFFIENYDGNNKDGNINECKCNAPTNDGVVDCTCKIPVTIDPNKQSKKPKPTTAPPSAISISKSIKSQPSYNGIGYDANNNLLIQYDATTTNSLFNIKNKNNLSSLPIYFMMIMYDIFYVYQLIQTPSTTVSDVQRADFNKYFNSIGKQLFEFNSKQIVNIMSIYTKVDLNKKINYNELENIRNYIILQFTPIISVINVHIYAINQIKLAFNNNSKSEFKNVENIQSTIDRLMSSHVTKMSDKKEGFVSYGNSSPNYSYYSFQSTPLIEGYEKATVIPSSYDMITVLPSIEISTDPTKTAVFYKDYTLNEMINFIILVMYDFKTIEEKTLNINQQSGNTDDNMIKMSYRDVLYGFIRIFGENMSSLVKKLFEITQKKYKQGALLELNDLNEKNKLVIIEINQFFVKINKAIDLINLLKDFWKEPETNKVREISNEEILNFLKRGDGLISKQNILLSEIIN